MIESSAVFQVLAHVDFPRRYWPGGTHRFVEKDYEEEYRAVFRALARSGRALEINTSSPLASAVGWPTSRSPVVDMIDTTERTTWGCSIAMVCTIIPPMDAPTTCAGAMPSTACAPA